MLEEYTKTSTVDQKIPLKIFFIDTTRALLRPFKKKNQFRKTFPTDPVEDEECPRKERKKRKRSWEEEKANVSPLHIPRKKASLLLATALILISL